MNIKTFNQSCNVVSKLEDAVRASNPKAFYTALQYAVLCKKVKARKQELVEEYRKLYKNEAGFYKETYAVYTYAKSGKKLFSDVCYKAPITSTDMLKPMEDRELTEECKALVEAGKAILTEEEYVDSKLQEEFNNVTVESIDVKDLVELGADDFDKVSTQLADEYQKAAVAKVINKPSVSLFLEQRYDIKTKLAQSYLKNKDKAAEQILSIGASKLGISVEDYAKMIVTKNKEWSNKSDELTAMIDEYRVAVKALFQKSPKDAIQALIDANEVAKDPTPEKVNEVFNKLVQ